MWLSYIFCVFTFSWWTPFTPTFTCRPGSIIRGSFERWHKTLALEYFVTAVFSSDTRSDEENKQLKPSCNHLQRWRLDIADVAMWTGTLWTDTVKASPRVDTSCPSATVVLLAQTFVHIWRTKQHRHENEKQGERRARLLPGYHSLSRGFGVQWLFIWLLFSLLF